MDNLFLGTVKYDKVNEEGLTQKVSEKYLFNALSFTDAEAVLAKEMEPFISGWFEIAEIKKQHVSELFESGIAGDKWYIVKAAFISIDEKSGKEKRNICRFYQQAATLEEAVKLFSKELASSMSDWMLVSVSETQIMDYFKEAE